VTPVVALSFHRDYRCRHAGACCTSGWTIPVESARFEQLDAAYRSGRVVLPLLQTTAPLLRFPQRAGDYTGLLATDDSGRCLFYAPQSASIEGASAARHPGSCIIHREFGHQALPDACQQFPRIAVLRPSSVAVTLSHYCPTAADLLFQDGSQAGLEVDPPFTSGRTLEGLDMREALPPLLRSDALFSWEAFSSWERFIVETLTRDRGSPGNAVGRIAWAAERLREWTPAAGDFDRWAEETLSDSREVDRIAPLDHAANSAIAAHRLVADTVPDEVSAPSAITEIERGWDVCLETTTLFERPVRRYLAARAWASWVGHEARSVRSFVRWIHLAWGVLLTEICRATREIESPLDGQGLKEAFRRTDLLLVHLASPRLIIQALGRLDATPLGRGTVGVSKLRDRHQRS
jgi:hypothetical protein